MKLTNFDYPVLSSWFALNGSRLDSRPYLSGAMEARALLSHALVHKEPLQSLTKGHFGGIYNGPQFVRNYVDNEEYGVPFLTSGTMLLADLSRVGLLRKKDAFSSKLSYLRIEEGMTLITCSGTIGRMVYAGPYMNGVWSSQDILKVVPDPEKILPGYLYAYLSSRFGVPLVTEGTYGAIIQHIEPEHIADLPVPVAPMNIQTTVHNLIKEMSRLRTESAKEYQQATAYLFNSIGIVDPPRHVWLNDKRREAFSITYLSDKTLRALNYDPRYVELCTNLERNQYDKLGELCDPRHFRSGIIFKRIDADPDFSVRLIGQREAFQVRPEGRWISRKSIDGLGLVVPKGTTIIAAHGTLGETELYCRSTYVSERTSEYAFSGDFVRCIPLEHRISSGYLFAFLRSETAFRILRCISIGGKQQAPHPVLLWNIPVPRLSPEKEREIHMLVESGVQKFDRSLQLEEDAWSTIEKWIEEAAQWPPSSR
jgi:hypothetical protein